MEDENQRILIVSKVDDLLLRFWRIELKEDEVEPDLDFYRQLIGFVHIRKIERLRNFEMYDNDNARFEFWTEDRYKNLYEKSIVNVDGLPWPKRFELYPMANIKTIHDLNEYNKWRMTVYKDQVRCVQKFTWTWAGGEIDPSIRNGWMHINPDRDINPLNPPVLEIPPHVINYIHRQRLKREQNGNN